MKVSATFYLEYKTIKKCREMGLNMSAICNEALRTAVMK
jgi:post-segregation antitoxin (ccd killing protein)